MILEICRSLWVRSYEMELLYGWHSAGELTRVVLGTPPPLFPTNPLEYDKGWVGNTTPILSSSSKQIRRGLYNKS